MTLHIITRSDSQSQSVHHCLSFIGKKDALLFIEDGTYCILNNALSDTLQSKNIQCYYLQADLSARGLSANDNVSIVDYNDFVTLTENHYPSQTWG
ncbi:MAG: sulfurtransferase complex subunit TusB [Pseudomonadales bacterium]|nr:sulfurtransferase complex subunit TusB [Pseudomonadales bacterium]